MDPMLRRMLELSSIRKRQAKASSGSFSTFEGMVIRTSDVIPSIISSVLMDMRVGNSPMVVESMNSKWEVAVLIFAKEVPMKGPLMEETLSKDLLILSSPMLY